MSEKKSKSDVIEAVAAKAGLSKADAAKSVDAVLSTVTETLTAGGEVNIPGFGKFLTVKKEASKGRNPATGAEIDIPARTAPKFTPGKGLKDAVNA